MSTPNANLTSPTTPASYVEPIDARIEGHFANLAEHYTSTVRNSRLLPVMAFVAVLGFFSLFVGILSLVEPDELPVFNQPYVQFAMIAGSIIAVVGGGLIGSRWTAKQLKGPLLAFCYLYDATREVYKSINTGFHGHLDRADELLHEFIAVSEATFTIEIKVHTRRGMVTVYERVNVGELIFKIGQECWWFQPTAESHLVAEAYRLMPTRLQRRLRLRMDLDRVYDCLRALLEYQYSLLNIRTSRDTSKSDPSHLGADSLRHSRLDAFARGIAALGDVQMPADSALPAMISSARAKVEWLVQVTLTSNNLLVSFISWLAILSAAFIPVTAVVLRRFGVSLDANSIITIAAAPFAGAIAMSAAVFSKSK